MKIPRDLKPGDRLWYSKTEYAIVEPSWLCPSCYDHDSIRARRLGYESADVWYLMGGHQGGGTKKVIRIERIASAKPKKAVALIHDCTVKPKSSRARMYAKELCNYAEHFDETGFPVIGKRIRTIARWLNGGAL